MIKKNKTISDKLKHMLNRLKKRLMSKHNETLWTYLKFKPAAELLISISTQTHYLKAFSLHAQPVSLYGS